ncbi:hypothetical protein KM803_10985 [Clostridium tyrobutyricum]|jgi:hypothetical protein|uniref:hypothetical protein n=1 Tax=Clostridium tyrobutyricum TaxID=1519 RepID=UPI00073D26E9|nr:hypothetical protein [Clostridium tyrobutyricum]MBV4425302.1 hypothetical protein [Clostridium tyrobutyricum]MBV4431847.1 hypothetical protein [Clostridium tyrobutyricum]
MKYSTDGCILEKSKFGIQINDKEFDKFLLEKFRNLKSLEDYKKYPAIIKIEIEILGNEVVEDAQEISVPQVSKMVDKKEIVVE